MTETENDVPTPEEILTSANTAMKDRWLAIFIQLSRSKRFTDFVESNYVIGDEVNDAARTITTTVVEKPVAIGPKISPPQHMKIAALLATAGCKNIAGTVSSLMVILGHEQSPLVTAEDDDIRKFTEAGEKLGNSIRKKLDA